MQVGRIQQVSDLRRWRREATLGREIVYLSQAGRQTDRLFCDEFGALFRRRGFEQAFFETQRPCFPRGWMGVCSGAAVAASDAAAMRGLLLASV